MSASATPVLASSFCTAGAGPMPMMRGSTPAATVATTRARGVRPYFFAAASDATITAPAPSFTPDALPAVMVPPTFLNGVFSFASCSSVVSPRGCSSTDTVCVPPFTGTSIGAISRWKKPASCAAFARCCERNANRSWSSRVTLNCSATFSPVSGIESMPYCAFSSGFTKRQPMVVSNTSICRENASVALPCTNGARVMLSTPPAMTSSASPPRIARDAIATASSPDPHSRLIVVPGTVTGRPDSSTAIRATLRLSSPAWLAQPRMTSSTASQSTPAWRAFSTRSGNAARSSVRTSFRAPP